MFEEISQTASWLKRRAFEVPPMPVNEGRPSSRGLSRSSAQISPPSASEIVALYERVYAETSAG